MVEESGAGRSNGLVNPGALGAPPASRSFAVEAYVGPKVAGWPFARFDVGQVGLQVRVVFPWRAARSADKETITAVSVRMTLAGVYCLRFEDSAGYLAEVHVHLVIRPRRVFDQLRRCGYVVVDWRSHEELDRLPTRRIWPWAVRRGR